MPKRIVGASDEWGTPQELWNRLNSFYQFDIDLCANEENRKTTRYCTNLANIKPQEPGIGWINPPFSKAYETLSMAFNLTVDNPGFNVVGIYRCDNMESKVWQDLILKECYWVFLFRGRVKYEDPKGERKSPMFPSALFGTTKWIEHFEEKEGVLIDLPGPMYRNKRKKQEYET